MSIAIFVGASMAWMVFGGSDEDVAPESGDAPETDNDALAAVVDSYSTEGHALVIAAPGVAANDVGLDPHSVTISLLAAPSHGSLTLSPDGAFVYVPDDGYAGPDTFEYELTSGTDTATASATIEVTGDPTAAEVAPPSTESDQAAASGDPALETAAGDGAHGAAVYSTNCAGCHGLDGGGTGGAGTVLVNRAFERDAVHLVTADGVGTMPGFGTILSESDITAVVDYVIGLGDGTAAAAAAPTGPAGTYSLHCALCHGVDGRGNEMGPGILDETEEIVEYVRFGEDSMPAYSVEQISDTELRELVTYIRTELGR